MQLEPWPGKRIGADDKKHRPLKCAHKDGTTVGCPFSGSRMQVEQNSHRNQKNGDHCVGETPRHVLCFRRLREQAEAGWTRCCCPPSWSAPSGPPRCSPGWGSSWPSWNKSEENESTVSTPILTPNTVTKGHCGSFGMPNNLRRTLTQESLKTSTAQIILTDKRKGKFVYPSFSPRPDDVGSDGGAGGSAFLLGHF